MFFQVMSTHHPPKRKKSGSENRKAKAARKEEEQQLGASMMKYFRGEKQESNKGMHGTGGLITNATVIGGEEDDFIELDNLKSKATIDDPASVSFHVCTSDVHRTDDKSEMNNGDVAEQGNGNEINKSDDGETEEDSTKSHVAQSDENNAFDHIPLKGNSEGGEDAPVHAEGEVSNLREENPIPFSINKAIAINKAHNTFDPASIVGLKLTIEEKALLAQMEPCQPEESLLSSRKKQMGTRLRYCSRQIFYHNRDDRRKWLSYSLSKDALYCIPCLLFTDTSSRGELKRASQGHAFACTGFSNWKKQYEAVARHESSAAHINAKVAHALSLQERTLNKFMEQQELIENERRKKEVLSNRQAMKRIVDTITFLGKQGLAFRGHRERLNQPVLNAGNFLEALRYLSKYDAVTDSHLEKARIEQEMLEARQGGKKGAKGRGSKLTFLSKTSQNAVINIIGEEIASEIVKMIRDCRAWALIADTTPDINKYEQLSICIRVVTRTGQCSEHLLFCKRASGATALEIYNCIAAALTNKGISFEKLVAQTYDGASNMSGCYNGLQAIIKEKVGDHVVYVHCYAHCLNLVLSDSAGASIQVIKLFDNLEKLYNLFQKSQKIHDLFESIQKEKKLNVISLKRINTVRWSSREFSLKAFLQRYDSIMHVLETVSTDTSFDGNQRSTSAGLLECFQTKQFVATAYLFREIFAITGPLSRYLQSINIDFGKAIGMIDTAIVQLSKLREEPETIIESVQQEFDPAEVSWKSTRIRNRRIMDGEHAIDDPAMTPSDHWKRDTFYVAMDKVSNGIKERFKKSQTLLEAFSFFAPSRFPYLQKQYKASHDLQKALKGFCDTYKLDSYRCADELFSFFKSFQKFSRFFQDEDDTDIVSCDDDDDATGDASPLPMLTIS